MPAFAQADRMVFFGTVRELRIFLRSLPKDGTLCSFIKTRLH